MTRKQIERWYDFLYAKADEIFKTYNPCGITADSSCIDDKRIALMRKDLKDKGCCYKCKYLSKNGCTVKALRCKLYTCDASFNTLCEINPIAGWQLRRLKRIAYKLNLMRTSFRTCKKNAINNWYFSNW